MPTSEGPTSEGRSHAGPAVGTTPRWRSFLLGFAATVSLGLLLVGSLNVWVDPIARFRSPANAPANTPSEEFYKLDRALQLHWLDAVATATDAPIWLFGSSRVLLGFDTCSRPEIQRLSLTGLSHREVQHVLAASLEDNDAPRSFYIEVSRSGALDPPIEDRRTQVPLRTALFSWHTAWVSMANLVQVATHRRLPASAQPGCSARTSPRIGVEASEVTPLLTTLRQQTDDADRTAMLERLLDTFVPYCSERRYRIVLFIAPYLVPPDRAEELRSIVKDHAAGLRTLLQAYAQRTPSCTFELHDFASEYSLETSQARWSTAHDWHNVSHFKASIGEGLIRRMLPTTTLSSAAPLPRGARPHALLVHWGQLAFHEDPAPRPGMRSDL